MKECDELIEILERLLGPNGCPWDREQTMQSMRHSLLEETCETIEAINLDDNQKMKEELGDLFFNVLFMCCLAEKEGRFTAADAFRNVIDKLIRRHPHIFGEAKVESSEQVLKQWEEIKKSEHKHKHPSILDSIPKELPALARAQKMYKKMKKAGYPLPSSLSESPVNEMQFGEAFFNLIRLSQEQGVDAEQALRKYLAHLVLVYNSFGE